MRGKRILWIAWIAVLLSVGIIELGFAPGVGDTMIVVEPTLTTGLLPGDHFWVDVNIINAKNVYTYQFKLGFQMGGSVIGAIKAVTGGFIGPLFAYNIFTLQGYVVVIGSRMGGVPGVSGNGTLASIEFAVIDAGESKLELFDTLLINPDLNTLPHQTRDGYYKGPTADLIRVNMVGGRGKSIGDMATFNMKVRNDADVPLYVFGRMDMVREDLAFVRLGAGQSFTGFGPPIVKYYYANEYNPWLEWDWTNPGAAVLGPPDGVYTSSNIYSAITSLYGFEDITLGPGELISEVRLEAYTQYPAGADDDNDLDAYGFGDFDWIGSLYGYSDWSWVQPRWVGSDTADDACPQLLTEEGFNSFELLVHYWTADGTSHGEGRIDSLRLRVEYSQMSPVNIPVYVVGPGEELELDTSTWVLTDYDVGKYHVTGICYYSYGGMVWNRGTKTKTFTWWCESD